MLPSQARLEMPVTMPVCGKQDLGLLLGLGIEDRCPVCGDHVSGYHYGLQTCESCKGFFKRTVQNKKVYTCADANSCVINKTQRKNCPFCRFRKCLDVGMKIEAVRENRVRGGRNKFGPMYKYHRALRLQAERYRQQVLMQIGTAFLQSPYSADLVRQYCVPDQKSDLAPDSSSQPLGRQQRTWYPPYALDDRRRNGASVVLPAELQGRNRYYGDVGLHGDDHIPRADSFSSVPEENFGYLQDGRLKEELRIPSPEDKIWSMPSLEALPPLPRRHTMATADGHAMLHRPVHRSVEPLHHFHKRRSFYHHASEERPLPSEVDLKYSPGFDAVDRSDEFQRNSDRIDYNILIQRNNDRNDHKIELQAMEEVDDEEEDNCDLGNSVTCDTQSPPAKPYSFPVSSANDSIAELLGSATDYDIICDKFKAVTEVVLRDFREVMIGQRVEEESEEVRVLIQLLCRLADQALFLMVEWARTAKLFVQLKVEDQIKLLENCWSEILVIDFLFLQTRHDQSEHLLTMSGHMIPMELFQIIGIADMKRKLQDIVEKLRCLKLHQDEVTCLKFLVLLNPDVGGLFDQSLVEKSQEKVSNVLMDYCNSISCSRFGQLLIQLPEIQVLSLQFEEYLYRQCLNGDIPKKSILEEMLNSSRR